MEKTAVISQNLHENAKKRRIILELHKNVKEINSTKATFIFINVQFLLIRKFPKYYISSK